MSQASRSFVYSYYFLTVAQGSHGASLPSSNNHVSSQDRHHPCRQSPLHGDIHTLAVDQQLVFCQRKLEEMGQMAQKERVRANKEETGRAQVELKLRNAEKALAVQQQRADTLEESLKLFSTDHARTDKLSNEQWLTVSDLVGLLRRQVIDGEEVDVPNLYHQKDALTYERNELKDNLSEKQNLAGSLQRDLDRVRMESEVMRTRHDAEISLARRDYDSLLGDLTVKHQQFNIHEERWKAFMRSKDAEIGDLSLKLAWHTQPKVGPVPKKSFAGYRSQQTG